MSRRCESHLFKRIKKEGKEDIYKCQNCPAYYRETIVIGQSAICWKCRNVFIMGPNNLKHKPTCSCMVGSKTKESTNVKTAKEVVIESLLSKLGG